MIMVQHFHSPADRALNCSLALGIHLNHAYSAYGGTESIRAMIDENVIYHSTQSNTITWLCGLHYRLSSILALLSSEGIGLTDKGRAISSLDQTVQAKANKEFYLKYILPRAGLIAIVKERGIK